MTDFDESIVQEFIEESSDHLETIESELLALEKNTENVDAEKINNIFRAIHSIKGASGFLGFDKIGSLSHVMETILSMIRSGDLQPTSAIVDGLLKGVDCLKTMFDDIQSSNEMEISELHESLLAFTGEKLVGEKVDEKEASGATLKDTEEVFGFILDEKCLSNIPRGNEFLYVLEYDLVEISAEGKSPVELVNELEGVGQIIETKVMRSKLDLNKGDLTSKIITKVLFSSVLDAEMISIGVALSEKNIHQINLIKEPDNIEIQIKKSNEITEENKTPTIVKNKAKSKDIQELESVRINVNVLDRLMTLAGELVLVRNQCMQSVERGLFKEMENTSQHLDMITTELQEAIMLTRMQPVGNVFNKLPRIVRDLSKKLEKEIEINTIGNEVEIDKTILQALADPLTHLVRNCCDHAIEIPDERVSANKSKVGAITIQAYHDAGQINIEVKDDGKGLDVEAIKSKALLNNVKTEEEMVLMSDKEILSLIMLPGFSTAKVVSDVSGRGVGMDVVKSSIEKLGGEVDLVSVAGVGTTISMRLPLTLAIIPSLIVGVNGQRYAIPQVSLEELVSLNHEEEARGIENTDNQEVYRLRDHLLPIIRFNDILESPLKYTNEKHLEIINKYQGDGSEIDNRSSLIFAVVKVRGQRFGIVVDEVFGTEEIVVKPMHVEMKKYEIYSGATVMGDGEVALILSTEGIAKHANITFNIAQEEQDANNDQKEAPQAVLMFKSGLNEQYAVSMADIRRVEKIQIKNIELIGNKEFITVDDVSIFVLRLEEVLDVSKCIEDEELYLLLPKETKRPYGILMSKVIDIVEVTSALDTESYLKKGVVGTDIIEDHMTMFLDMNSLLEQADPEWFLEYSNNNKMITASA